MQAYKPLGIASGMDHIRAANFILSSIIFNAVFFAKGSGVNKDDTV